MTILCLPRPRDCGFEVFENVGGGAAQLEGGFGGDGLDVGGAADAVGAKDFCGMGSWLGRLVQLPGAVEFDACTVGRFDIRSTLRFAEEHVRRQSSEVQFLRRMKIRSGQRRF